jgi:hypothetical protein
MSLQVIRQAVSGTAQSQVFRIRITNEAGVISDRTKTQCFASAFVQRNNPQKISQKYIRIFQKL